MVTNLINAHPKAMNTLSTFLEYPPYNEVLEFKYFEKFLTIVQFKYFIAN